MSLRPIEITFTVGDALRKARELRGWTIEELARRSKLDKNTISRAEKGNARRQTQERIAHALDVPFDRLQALVAHRPEAHTLEELRLQITRAMDAVEQLVPSRDPPSGSRPTLGKRTG